MSGLWTAVRLLLLLLVVGVAVAEEPARPDTVVVRTPEGEPVPEAVLFASDREVDGRPVFDPDLPVVARADAEGRVGAVPRGTGRLVAWAPGRAAVPVPDTEFEAAVQLPLAGAIDGRVRFAKGAPARAVRVYAVPLGAGGLAHRSRSDADGTYAFEALPPGSYRLYLRRADQRLQSLGDVVAGETAPEVRLVGVASVRGKILDGDGVSGAVAAGVPLRIVPVAEGPSALGFETTSDEQGRFLVGDMRPGIYRAEVMASDFELDQESPRFEVRRGRTQTLSPWFVRRRQPVNGSVVDPDRKPVAGATVRLIRELPDDPEAEREVLSLRPVRSGASGRFVIPRVSPGDGYRLVVTADGYAPWISGRFRVDRRMPTALKPARIVPGWTLELRVLDEGGRPVEGAAVRATPTSHPAGPEDAVRGAFVRRGRTNAEGTVLLPDLLDSDIGLVVRGARWLTHESVVAAPVAGRARRVEVSVAAAARVTGQVLRDGGGGLASAPVRALFEDGSPARETVTDERGRFAFEALRPVTVDLEVRATDGGLVLARRHGVLPGNELHVEIVVPPLASISGTVAGFDPSGPKPRVLVEAPVRDVDLGRFRWETVVDAQVDASGPGDARFEAEGLPPGPYALRAVQGSRDTSVLSLRLDESSIEGVSLELPDGARLVGTVLDNDDQPVVGAEVTFDRLRGDGDVPARPGGSPVVATDDDGAFVADGLAPGIWRVTARLPRRADAVVEVRVAEGDVLVLDDLVLATGGAVQGVVRTPDGDPVDGASLRLRRADRHEEGRRVHAGEDGQYRFAFVSPGRYELSLDDDLGGAPADEIALEVAGDETVEVDFAPPGSGRIEGTVSIAGRRLGGAALELVSIPFDDPTSEVRRYRARTASDGSFDFEGLGGGPYLLALLHGSARIEREVWLDDGDRVTLDVEGRAARLLGSVETAFGRPVAGASVTARAIDQDAEVILDGVVARGRTDPQGAFLLSGVPVGWYRIEVEAPGLPPGVVPVAEAELEGADRPVDVVMGRGGDIELTVVDPALRGVTGAQVWVEDPSGAAMHRRPFVTGPGGQLRIEGVPAGRARVRIQARGFGRPRVQVVSIGEGDLSVVRVKLRQPGTLVVFVHGSGRDPVTRARVAILREDTGEVVERRRPLGRAGVDPRWGYTPKTGRLEIEELEAGAYKVVVEAGDTYAVSELGVDVGAGQTTVARIELTPR